MSKKKNNNCFVIIYIILNLVLMSACEMSLNDETMEDMHINGETMEDMHINGYITVSRNGSPVVGSKVVLKTSDSNIILSTTTSDDNGYFSFVLAHTNGEFVVEATKDSRASSRVVFTVTEELIPMLILQQFPIVFAERSTQAPTIKVDGIVANQEISISVPISAKAIGANPIVSGYERKALSLAIGSIGSGDYVQSEDSTDLVYEIDPTTLISGVTYLEFVCYDNNNNQGILIIPIKVSFPKLDEIGNAPASSVNSDVIIISKTYAENIIKYSVDENTHVSVKIYVNYQDGAYRGIMVYRTLVSDDSTNSISEYVGFSNNMKSYSETDISGSYFTFVDALPFLNEGNIYAYSVKYYYYKEDGTIRITDSSPIIQVPILPRYELYLKLPENNKEFKTVNSYIAFQWDAIYHSLSFSTLPEESFFTREDTLRLQEVASDENLYQKTIEHDDAINVTGLYAENFDTDLFTGIPLAGKFISWNVKSILKYEYKHIDGASSETVYKVLARSYPTYPTLGSSHNGSYYFTIR